jgi:hypothetical protein
MPSFGKQANPLALAVVVALVAGCVTVQELKLTGDVMIDGPYAITNGPPRDRVLWQYRTALAAMRLGKFDMAKDLLDDALRRIQGVYQADPEARKSRGYFSPEARKTFIGEPYERSMAYFYRGVLYWRDGELDNARACFRSGEFEDSDTHDHKYAGDYVLFDYLDGLASAKLGGDGDDAFKRALSHARNINLPPYDLDANVLFIVEFGPGPVKYATGQYSEELRFHTRASPVLAASVKIDSTEFAVAPCDDLNFQATTRGGRVMDRILANKAVFKGATDAAGNAALIGGAILASQQGQHSSVDEVGAGLLVAGLLTKIISASTTPQADVRSWDNLPQFISFANVRVAPGTHTATILFLDSQQHPIANLTKAVTFTVTDPHRSSVVFISDQSATPQTL